MNKYGIQPVLLLRAACIASAVWVAVLFARHYAMSQPFLVMLAAWLVMQTTLGTPLRQSLQHVLVLMLSLFAASLCYLYAASSVWILSVAVLAVSCLFYARAPIRQGQLSFAFMAGLIFLLILTITPPSHYPLDVRLYDTMLGASIGILMSMVLLKMRVNDAFVQGVVPLLRTYRTGLSSVMLTICQEPSDEISEQIIALNKVQNQLPTWVDEPGFNPQLRRGYQHFLNKTEQLGYLLSEMQYLASLQFEQDVLAQLKQPVLDSLMQCERLLTHLINTLLNPKLRGQVLTDVDTDLSSLGHAFKAAMPLSLEMLDLSPSYIRCTELIYDVRNFHHILLILNESLR